VSPSRPPNKLFGLGPIFAPGRLWLALACVAALALGLTRLSHAPLWCDEIYTARWTRLDLPHLLAALRTDLHPPLYFILENQFVALFGETPFGLRIFSVLTGVLTVAASFWAFRPLLNDRLSAAAAWLLALSPQFFLYARMARYYALAALVAMIAHGLFVRLAVKRGRPRSWFLDGVSVALLLYTSYVGVCVVLAHFVWAVAARRRRPRLWKAWLAAAAGGFALFGPWLGALIEQTRTAHGLMPAVVSGPGGLMLMLGYDAHALTASELLTPWSIAGVAGLLAGTGLLLGGALAAVRRGLGRSVLTPALVALGLAWIVVGVLAHATPFVGLPARTLFMWPFAAAVLAIGALDPVYHRGSRVLVTVVLLAAWAAGWAQLYRAQGWMNPIYLTPGPQAAAAIAHDAREGDLILAEDDTGVNYALEMARFSGRVIDPNDDAAAVAALADSSLHTVWFARLSRDGSARVRTAESVEARLTQWGERTAERGFLESDPVYRAAKQRLLGLPGWRWRIVVQRWDRRAGGDAPRPGTAFAPASGAAAASSSARD
jgi:4-amino-4-deoxy-L-arabinose transferase-like glycosyltransferase